MKTQNLIDINVDLLSTISELKREIVELKIKNLMIEEKLLQLKQTEIKCNSSLSKDSVSYQEGKLLAEQLNRKTTMERVVKIGEDIQKLTEEFLFEFIDDSLINNIIVKVNKYLIAEFNLRFVKDYQVYHEEKDIIIDLKMHGSPDEIFKITYTLG